MEKEGVTQDDVERAKNNPLVAEIFQTLETHATELMRYYSENCWLGANSYVDHQWGKIEGILTEMAREIKRENP